MATVNASVTVRFTVPLADGSQRLCSFDLDTTDATQLRITDSQSHIALGMLITGVVDETLKAVREATARAAASLQGDHDGHG